MPETRRAFRTRPRQLGDQMTSDELVTALGRAVLTEAGRDLIKNSES
jgi:hypothetical protein